MIKQDYVIYLFITIASIDTILFLYLLINKIIKKIINKKIDVLYENYSEIIGNYIVSENKYDIDKPSTAIKKRAFEKVILDYLEFIDGDIKTDLLEFIDKEQFTRDILKNIHSWNPWKQKIGVYNAGKFKVKDTIPQLLELLQTNK